MRSPRLEPLAWALLLLLMAVAPASAQEGIEGYKPTLTLSIQTSEEGNVLTMFVNERLVEKQAWKDDPLCTGEAVLSHLSFRSNDLARVNLEALVFDELGGLGRFSWKEHANGFKEVRFLLNGKTIRRLNSDGEPISEPPEPCPDGTCNPEPAPALDCIPSTTVISESCGPWTEAGSTTHSFPLPCTLGVDRCGNFILGTKSCTVTVTQWAQTCTLVTLTTFTPSRPGVSCPSPVVLPDVVTRQGEPTTGTPVCGVCS